MILYLKSKSYLDSMQINYYTKNMHNWNVNRINAMNHSKATSYRN